MEHVTAINRTKLVNDALARIRECTTAIDQSTLEIYNGPLEHAVLIDHPWTVVEYCCIVEVKVVFDFWLFKWRSHEVLMAVREPSCDPTLEYTIFDPRLDRALLEKELTQLGHQIGSTSVNCHDRTRS